MGRRNRKLLVPEARDGLNQLKYQVMENEGYHIHPQNNKQLNLEIAKEQGIQMNRSYNGEMTAKEAGKIGGPIGGKLVAELIRMGKNQLNK
ncbi:small, acid-soluble spore protein, alpha/beta type [Bacillus salitolerans]|uniref:Small, acid-soluble spore protein, alpha/beta type n=1 Tax=Bacillus salitolerans TaxID=1437434 RepID=A0ABW4LK53_9BACI